MQLRAALGHGGVDRKDASSDSRQNLVINPASKHSPWATYRRIRGSEFYFERLVVN